MLPPDVVLKGAAAVVAATLAALVMGAAPRDRAARWLGIFFLLIALNQGAEAWRTLALDPLAPYRIATIAAALDPVAIWVVVEILAHGLPRARPLLLVGTVGGALALLSGWALPDLTPEVSSRVLPTALAVFTFAVYFAAARTALRKLAEAGAAARRWRPLVMATAIIVLPQATAIIDQLAFLAPSMPPSGSRLVAGAVVAVLVALALAHGVRRDEKGARGALGAGLALSFALLALSKTLDIASALTATPDFDLDALWVIPGRASASVKWLVVGVLVSRAVFRDGAVEATTRARRRGARGLVALGALIAGTVGFTLVTTFTAPSSDAVPWREASILAVVVLLSQAFRDVVDKVAARVYGVPRGGAAAPIEADEPIRAGARLAGRYDVERYLGRGGSGRVFLARDTLIGRHVALKETRTAVHEARAASRVAHPGVVSVFDVIEREEGALLVTEFVEGGSLADLVERSGRLTGTRGAAAALALAEALAAVHEQGLVHGDLKPANVLLDPTGRPKLADFGLASSARGTTLLSVGRGGTPGYLAPEVLEGARPDARGDVYALGLVLRRAVDIPELARAIGTATARDPALRFRDGRALADAIADALNARTEEGSAQRR